MFVANYPDGSPIAVSNWATPMATHLAKLGFTFKRHDVVNMCGIWTKPNDTGSQYGEVRVFELDAEEILTD